MRDPREPPPLWRVWFPVLATAGILLAILIGSWIATRATVTYL